MRYSIGTLLIGFTVVSVLLAILGWGWQRYPGVCVGLGAGALISCGSLTLNHLRRGLDLPGRLPAVLLLVLVVSAVGSAVLHVANLGALALGAVLGVVAYQVGPVWMVWALTQSGVESD